MKKLMLFIGAGIVGLGLLFFSATYFYYENIKKTFNVEKVLDPEATYVDDEILNAKYSKNEITVITLRAVNWECFKSSIFGYDKPEIKEFCDAMNHPNNFIFKWLKIETGTSFEWYLFDKKIPKKNALGF